MRLQKKMWALETRMDPKNTMWIDSKHAFILTVNKSLRFEYHLASTLELNTDRLGSHISLASD